MKWEYKQLINAGEETLNKLGLEGWELLETKIIPADFIYIEERSGDNVGMKMIYIFKRPLQDNSSQVETLFKKD